MAKFYHSVLLATVAMVAALGCGTSEGRRKVKPPCVSAEDCTSESDAGQPACQVPTCESGSCGLAPAADGTQCDDGDPSTASDVCVSGTCKGTPGQCPTPAGSCQVGTVDPDTKACIVHNQPDGTPCDDGDLCTQVDACKGGQCEGSSPKACPASDACHLAGVCDKKTGDCTNPAAPDGTSCDDARVCTEHDACASGACKGTAVVCDDGRSCSVDSCDEALGGCHSDTSACACKTDADCSDGNPCNGAETCNTANSTCISGTSVDCSTLTDACHTGSCDRTTGTCSATPVADGTACNDGDQCTQSDACQNGACVGSNPVVCGPSSQCSGGTTCDPATGACVTGDKPDGTPCDDGDPCTTGEVCKGGGCTGAVPVICTAQDQCHGAGTCNPATGVCSNPPQADGVPCDDGDLCTTADVCQAGACSAGTPVTCAASDACHVPGTCDPATGACSNPAAPNGAACDDGLLCTIGDLCTNGACAGTAIPCSDGLACTADSCSEALGGCTFDASGCACTKDADCDDGNACNGAEKCNVSAGTCAAGTPVDCSGSGDACNVGSCNPATGACVKVPKANGTACNDGNACTQSDVCQAGACTGQNPIVCTAKDACHGPGTCNPATGVCSSPAKPDGTTCSDGSLCTQTDTCQSGTCVGQNPVVCTALDQCHQAGTCNAATGACSSPAKANGTACNDGNACTRTDTCQAGACTGGNAVVCTAQDQCHNAGTCSPATGACSNPAKANGTACNDGNACTQSDTCQAGACAGASPVVCTALDQCHTVGTCDSATGACSNPVAANGTTCNDGNACTRTDTCQAGTCTGGNAVVCVAQDQCHNAGTCNTTTGACSKPAKANGTTCNDGLACTTGDVCTSGVCGGAQVTCNDGIACTVDSCSEAIGGCTVDTSACGCTKDADCSDGNPCNGAETCDLAKLTCKAGTPVDCSAFTNACNTGTCSKSTGLCAAVPKADGTACNDGNACTQTDTCVAGSCTGGNAVVCVAQDACHVAGVCAAATGTCSNPVAVNGTACNDGNACTRTDTCQTGVCTGANSVVCTALDSCHTAGVCNTGTGVCTNPVKNNGTACSDGNACTLTDTCQTGVCTAGPSVVCTALDQCHGVGTCNTTTGACSNPAKKDGTVCDDGSACTKSDTCVTGTCTGAQPVVCTALSQCYDVGTCDPANGTCSNPPKASGSPCDDANFCTQGDACNGSGSCSLSSPVVCPVPVNPCKVAQCVAATGCTQVNAKDGKACNDGNACTQVDVCRTGVCAGTTPRNDAVGDWADAPGGQGGGPLSVDLLTYSDGTLAAVGVYTGPIVFAGTQLAFDAKMRQALYLTTYKEVGSGGNGVVVTTAAIGGAGDSQVPGAFTVGSAVMHPDDSFTVVGTFAGNAQFGLAATAKAVSVNVTTLFIARFEKDGQIRWLVTGDAAGALTGEAVAGFGNGSLVVSGINNQPLVITDTGGVQATVPAGGVYAVRLSPTGQGVFAHRVALRGALRGAALGVRSVTTHSDGSFTLLGAFATSATFGINGEATQTSQGAADAWILRLESTAKFRWAGRLGSETADRAGDIQGVKGDDVVVAVDTTGTTPTLDAASSVSLHTLGSGPFETKIVRLDPTGKPLAASLIGYPKGASRSFDLAFDSDGSFTLAGVFIDPIDVYDEVGFGAGAPAGTPLFLNPGGQIERIFVARYEDTLARRWAISADGSNSGMLSQVGWDLVLAVHPSLSVTVGGMFQSTATFGYALPKSLFPADKGGAPFVVHMDSEEQLDYCP